MKTVEYYIAVDGTKFDDEHECMAYESKLLLCSDGLYVYDEEFNKITELGKLDCAWYVKCDNIDACKAFKTANDMNGLPTPFDDDNNYSIGSWYWNDDYDTWCNIDDKIAELKSEIKRLENIFKEV